MTPAAPARAVAAAALLALALSVPRAAVAVPARLTAAIEVGAGGSSAAAGVGAADAFTQVAPEARLDVALAPAWKLALSGDAAWVHYLRSGQDVLAESSELALRFLGVEPLEVALSVGGEHADFGDTGGSLDPPLLLSPTVLSTSAARLAVDARWRTGGLAEPFAGVSGALRDSTSAPGVVVSSNEGVAVAGVRFALARTLALTAAYRLQASGSDAPDFTATSHALIADLAGELGPVRAALGVQLRTVSFATGSQEDLGRVVVSARLPLSRAFEVGAFYAGSRSAVRGPDGPSDTRHLVLLALRWRAPEVHL